jgi:hypothetical protein
MKTSKLEHKIGATDSDGNPMEIVISLNDDCKNGHADFSITATGWEKGKVRSDRNMIYGGCCHEAILEARPDLKMFVDLHLSDCKGAPMYAIENGRYHMKEDPTGRIPKEYLRITDQEYDVLKTATESAIFFAITLQNLGVVKRWQEEATAAIKKLEELTGNEFEDKSTRYQFEMPSEFEINYFKKALAEGYYSPDQVEQRRIDKLEAEKAKKFQDILDQKDKAIKKVEIEYNVDFAILYYGEDLFENFIYYNHRNEVVFNWLDYKKKITEDQFNEFLKSVEYTNLPEGIKFSLKK